MKNPKVLWAWICGVIVVIALVAGAAWYIYGVMGKPTTGPLAVHAPVGQLIPGFPPELILDSAAQPDNSYSINYSSSTNQYTAEWNSSSSLASLYAEYQNYAKANGWTVTNQADGPTFKGIYATNASSSAAVNVVITSRTDGSSEVTVSYIMK